MVLEKTKKKISRLVDDKHALNKVKYARESFRFEQEAKKYWDSLSEEERKKIAAQVYMENHADLVAFANKAEEEASREKIKQKRELLKLNAMEFRQKTWMMVVKVLVIALLVAVIWAIASAMIEYTVDSLNGKY